MKERSFFIKTIKDSRFTLVTGWALGALINVFHWYATVTFLALAIGVFLFIYMDNRKELKRKDVTQKEIESLAAPIPGAEEAARRTNHNLLVSGNAIEIVTHPNLNSAVNPRDVGWDPKEIEIIQDLEFDASEILSQAGGLREFEPPNHKKYCLVNLSFVTSESDHLSLILKETDFFTIETAKRLLQDHPGVAEKYGHVSPAKNRIPSSLCLHFTVRLMSGEILLMKRVSGMSYHENMWSATGEEQLSEGDLSAEHPLERLFKRALGEEILHLGGVERHPEFMKRIDEHIEYMRIYSIGVEWPIYNPAVFGAVQLVDDADALRETLKGRKRGSESYGQDDREGLFYTINKKEIENLLSSGRGTAKGVFNDLETTIEASALHPTTRYRLFRYLRTLKRGRLFK